MFYSFYFKTKEKNLKSFFSSKKENLIKDVIIV